MSTQTSRTNRPSSVCPPASGRSPSSRFTPEDIAASAEELIAFHDRLQDCFTRREQRAWWLTLAGGILAIEVGALLLWGNLVTQVKTYFLLIEVLGIWWLVDGIFDIVHLFTDHCQWAWKLFMGLVSIIAGSYILMYPMLVGTEIPSLPQADSPIPKDTWCAVVVLRLRGMESIGSTCNHRHGSLQQGVAGAGAASIRCGVSCGPGSVGCRRDEWDAR